MMKKRCANCMYLETPPQSEPCTSCKRFYAHDGIGTDNFEPCTRLYLREQLAEVTAERDALQQRYDALKDCYLVHEEPDGHGGMVVDFGKVLVEHDELLTKANDEIESMQCELADKDAKIHAKDIEIAEHRRHVATVMQREAENARILAAVKHENQSLYEYRTRSIEELAAKQAIIDQLKSELAEVKAELTTRILDDSEFSRDIAKIVAAELQRRAK